MLQEVGHHRGLCEAFSYCASIITEFCGLIKHGGFPVLVEWAAFY
jgi:hypothetical protein